MDIGGHRFFSKSDRVMRWWLDLMPVEAGYRANPDSFAIRASSGTFPRPPLRPILTTKIW
jgi:hypothetical protein